MRWENRWFGELENLPQASRKKINLSILWKRSAIELQSISVHYERLKTCPDRLHWCCVFSTSTVSPPLVSFCRKNFHAAVAVAFAAPFLLILLKSRPTDDETFLPFSGSLWKRFLIFKAEKNVRSFAFRGVYGSAYHISRNENTKGTTTSKKMSSTYHIVCNTRRWVEVRQLRDVGPCQAAAVGAAEGFSPDSHFKPLVE